MKKYLLFFIYISVTYSQVYFLDPQQEKIKQHIETIIVKKKSHALESLGLMCDGNPQNKSKDQELLRKHKLITSSGEPQSGVCDVISLWYHAILREKLLNIGEKSNEVGNSEG